MKSREHTGLSQDLPFFVLFVPFVVKLFAVAVVDC
jgi:hypothetical protein